MEKMTIESTENNEFDPEVLGAKFDAEDFVTFVGDLRRKVKSNPAIRFNIVMDWVSVQKARSAKALLDQYASRLNIDSIAIRATRQQYQKDVNAFESGIKWIEI